ncbi:putative odorant-binding protein A10 [Pectinophora gossypiella]|uniref:putative odorant-binding protein A10 n=1 Tax=Pectinophora gossypiella TaxID=13191 RepID=UPI00214DF510|nr:putative odorant-binding protein A10 [Pectinophora gossypiella]
MQTILLFCLMVASLASSMAGPLMTDAQLEQTLADRSTMQRHLRCATGEGPCDPVGRRLRTVGPLVLRGTCPQCSAQETYQIRRTLAFIQRNYPREWAKIVRQYG